MLFAVLALSACLLMARIARDPRGGRLLDPRRHRARAAHRPRRADPQRGDLLGLAWLIVAWGIPGLSRGARGGLVGTAAVVAVLVFLPWAIRDWVVFGSPLPGPGGDQRAVHHRLRHLRLERPADPVALPRGRAGPPDRDAGRGPHPQPVQRPAVARPADLAHRPARAAVGSPRRRHPAGRHRQLHDLPGDQPRLPGRHDVGHVPPRRPVRSRSCSSCRRSWRSTPRSPGVGARQGWTRPVAWLGPLARHLRLAALLGRAAAELRRRARATTAQRYDELAAVGWPRSATRSTRRPARSSPTSRSGWPRPQRIPSLALPDEPPRDVLDLASTLRGPARRSCSTPRARTGRTTSTPASTAPTASASSTSGSTAGSTEAIALGDVRAFEVVCP